MTARSALAIVRNPILALPGFSLLRALPADSRAALRAILINLRDACRLNAEKSWRTHKAPMALYWKACGVYANHIARALA